METADHLLISSVSHNSEWWSITTAANLSGQWIAAKTYLPVAKEETEVLQRGEVISSASRLRQEKIKCLHSVTNALFQMLPLPFKRPLWAWMANEQFWGYHSQFLFSLPLPPSIPHHICDGNPKSPLCFYSECESAAWYIKETGRQRRKEWRGEEQESERDE